MTDFAFSPVAIVRACGSLHAPEMISRPAFPSSLRRSARAAPTPPRKHLAAHADQNAAKSRIDGTDIKRGDESKSVAVEYSLTKLGKTFIVPLRSICRWADRHGKHLNATIQLRHWIKCTIQFSLRLTFTQMWMAAEQLSKFQGSLRLVASQSKIR
jgi:hypothetical protein